MTAEQTTTAEDEQHAEGADFDAFWASHGTAETVRICGEDVPVPRDVPLWLVMRAGNTGVQDADEIREMVSTLYGEHQLDRWIARGLGARQLSVILAWSVAKGQGAAITFDEAARRVEEMMSNPPENRRQRRSKKKGKR